MFIEEEEKTMYTTFKQFYWTNQSIGREREKFLSLSFFSGVNLFLTCAYTTRLNYVRHVILPNTINASTTFVI